MIPAVRWALGLAGGGLIGYGAHRIASGGLTTDPADLTRWLLAGVLGHDLLIAGLTAAVGWLLARLVPATVRPAVQGGLLVAASLVLIAVPVLSGRGGHGNPSTDPLDYPRNLAVALLAVAAGTAAAAAWRVRRANRSARQSTSDSGGPGPTTPR
ncbi:MAG: hypothetical protein V7637_4341 [Mycobacteriales bacterium]